MHQFFLQPLAQVAGDLLTFEQKLQGQQQFIVGLYAPVFLVGLILLIGFTLHIHQRPLDWTYPLQKLERRPWTGRDALMIVLPLIIVQCVFHILLLLSSRWIDVESAGMEKFLLVTQSMVFHWLCFGLIALSLMLRKRSWHEAFGLTIRRAWREILIGLAVIVGVMPLIIGYNFVAGLVMEWMDYVPRVQEVTRIISDRSDPVSTIYFVLLAVVVAPVVEELLFRGVLLPAIARKVGVKAAMALVSLLFAAVHGLYLPQASIFFILSFAFSLTYLYRKSLLAPMAMHAFFNGLSIAVILRM